MTAVNRYSVRALSFPSFLSFILVVKDLPRAENPALLDEGGAVSSFKDSADFQFSSVSQNRYSFRVMEPYTQESDASK